MQFYISPPRLKLLREQSGLSVAKFTRRLKKLKHPVSARTISDIEKDQNEKRPINLNTLTNLSKGLVVSHKVLSGDTPLPEKRPPSGPVQVQLDARTCLNYELIERRYDVTLQDIVNIAPVLFMKAAKDSIAKQRGVLEEEVLEEIKKLGFPPGVARPQSLETVSEGLIEHFYNEDDEYVRLFADRIQALNGFDLFEATVPYDNDGIPGESPNPFASYIQEICATELGRNVADLEDAPYFSNHSFFPGDRIPINSVCNEDLKKITLGSGNALLALSTGAVRIKDIPEELWEPRRAGDRVAWLEDAYTSSIELDEDGYPVKRKY
jgi:transcriptional regulator with XRE-family HTH domain